MSDQIQAVLLTGGASRRMGEDKSRLAVGGEPLAARIARLLSEGGYPVLVSGREPIPPYPFAADRREFAGPLAAIADIPSSAPLVFLVSCDLPGFDPEIVDRLQGALGDREAAVPIIDGRLQPLCALYRSAALDVARDLAAAGESRLMRLLDRLKVVEVEGIDPRQAANVNTPEEWARFRDLT